MEDYILVIGIVILAYSLFSSVLAQWAVTMPMVFLALGILVGLQGAVMDLDAAHLFHDLADLTLAMLLFADATDLDRDSIKKIRARTARMLLLGLPLAIVFGAILNTLLMPDWPLWEACLLAALLAPTDAALGQAIQSNQRIPLAFRNAMSAESGLNDGLALPFVIFFAGLAVGTGSQAEASNSLLSLVAAQIGIGALVGFALGYLIGKVRNFVMDRNLMDDGLGAVATLAIVGVIFVAAEHAGGNSFVAVFVGGLAFAKAASGSVHRAREFLEGDGQFLAIICFFYIGAFFVPGALGYVSVSVVLLILLSLFVVRPIAIWLSLTGTDTSPNERLFYGWFGPRGLATALFAVLVVLDFEGIRNSDTILAIAVLTVVTSAFAHGISAKWAPEIFGLKPDAASDGAADD